MLFAACKEKQEGSPEPAGDTSNGKVVPEKANAVEVSEAEMNEGQALYATHCLVCHQVTGGGVSGLNPPLKGTPYVLGPKERFLGILLRGSNQGLEIDGVTYSNAMPGFAMLSNKELATLATYVRNSFGNRAGPVSEAEVAAVRAAQ